MTSPEKSTLADLRIDRGEPKRRGAAGWVWLAVLLVLLGLAWLGWRLLGARAVEVRTLTVRESGGGGDARTVLNASGYVTARRQATVSSKVTGKVTEVFIEEGMKVAAGQVMARLDTSNIEANLRLAEAQLAAARTATDETAALLAQAEVELRRIRELARERIASAAELDAAEAQAKSLQARLARQKQEAVVAERQLGLWQQELEDRIIRAPFAGVVITKNAQPGEMISPISAGSGFTRTGIGTIVDMSSLEIEVDVNESFINRVEPNQRVRATLDAYPDWEIPTKVIAIIPAADRQKATVRVRIGFDELDPRILPDMGVKVAFRDAAGPAAAARNVRVPSDAVRRDDGRPVVLVVESGKVERRAVNAGAENNGETVILAGLRAGERIVIEGPPNLADGTRVKEMKQ